MKSIILFLYRMRGSRGIDSMPVYAGGLPEALDKFHAAMGNRGCERDKYEITRHRAIRESDLQWNIDNHKDLVRRLSPEDRLALLQDRQARQLARRGWVDNLTQWLEQLADRQPV
jgi:hypothetical protein